MREQTLDSIHTAPPRGMPKDWEQAPWHAALDMRLVLPRHSDPEVADVLEMHDKIDVVLRKRDELAGRPRKPFVAKAPAVIIRRG